MNFNIVPYDMPSMVQYSLMNCGIFGSKCPACSFHELPLNWLCHSVRGIHECTMCLRAVDEENLPAEHELLSQHGSQI